MEEIRIDMQEGEARHTTRVKMPKRPCYGVRNLDVYVRKTVLGLLPILPGSQGVLGSQRREID